MKISDEFMTGEELSAGTTFKAISEHLASDLGDEVVILNLKNGKYYGFNSVGACIWSLVQIASTQERIEEGLRTEFNVDPLECSHEVSSFLDKMITEGLVEVKNALPFAIHCV